MRKFNQTEYLLAVGCLIIFGVITLAYPNLENDYWKNIVVNLASGALSFAIIYFILKIQGISIDGGVSEELNEKKKKTNEVLLDLVVTQRMRVNKQLVFLYESKDEFYKRLCYKILDNYLADFEVESHGFEIKKEFLSLYVYIQFWDYMIEKQKEKKEKIIVCATHSTSLSLWSASEPKYVSYRNTLLYKQEMFIKSGGAIYRIFLNKGHHDYSGIKDEMANIKIEVFEFTSTPATFINNLGYNYLFIYGQNFMIKWEENEGEIMKSTMTYGVDEDAIEHWNLIRLSSTPHKGNKEDKPFEWVDN